MKNRLLTRAEINDIVRADADKNNVSFNRLTDAGLHEVVGKIEDAVINKIKEGELK